MAQQMMNALLVLHAVVCSIHYIACVPCQGSYIPRSVHAHEGPPPFLHYPPQQSPIAICTRLSVQRRLPNLHFIDGLSEFAPITVLNTGSTVKLILADERTKMPRMWGGPLNGQFAFSNLHFHWGPTDFQGSEHQINSNRLAMEVHIVHFNYKYGSVEEAHKHADGLAVVAFLLKVQYFRQIVSKGGMLIKSNSRPVQQLNGRTVIYAV